MRRSCAPAAIVLTICHVAAGATTVSLPAAADNTLFESTDGGLSSGAGIWFFAGTTDQGAVRRGVIRFDLAAIPAGSTILSATLTLHMSRTNTATEEVSLHRAGQAWGEAGSVAPGQGGGGGLSEPGDATWLHTFYDDQFWATPGGDFDVAASASALVAGNGFYDWPGLADDVQAWLADPVSNNGWLLKGNEAFFTTAKRFDSREHPTESVRPRLIVEYEPIPAPGALPLAALSLAIGRRRRA